MNIIGIDLGGTKINAAVINENGQIQEQITVQTPKTGANEILLELERIINEFKNKFQNVLSVGIASAGRIDNHTGKVIYATKNLPGWTGVDIKFQIQSRCGIQVFAENDVNAAAIGEGWLGAAKNYNHFALLTIGTGLGGALVHNGSLINGPTGSVGEIGHTILIPNGKICNCGQRGCLEQYVSGTALTEMAKELNPKWNSYDLIKQAIEGHQGSINKLNVFIYHLAVALITVHNFYDPEIIIIGGGVGATLPGWQERLEKQLKELTPHEIKVMPAMLGNNAGILGAAKLVLDSKK